MITCGLEGRLDDTSLSQSCRTRQAIPRRQANGGSPLIQDLARQAVRMARERGTRGGMDVLRDCNKGTPFDFAAQQILEKNS